MEESIVGVFKEFGFPAVMIALILVGLYRVSVWFAKHVASPLTESHINLVEQLGKSDQRQTEILARLEQSQAASDARSERNHAEIIGTQREIVSILKDQFDNRGLERNHS